MNLSSPRLSFSLIGLQDLEDIHALHSLPETDQFNTLGLPENIDQTQKIIEPWIADHKHDEISNYTFSIRRKSDHSFVGLIALKKSTPKFRSAEVWYKLHKDFWNQGYGTEALDRILEFGFRELELHRIEAGCAVDNVGSIRILEKVGMKREGRKRKILPLSSGWSDNFHYAILEEEFGEGKN